MNSLFSVSLKESVPGKDVAILEIEGSFQSNTLQIFKDAVDPLIGHGVKNYIFYCSKMTFASSAALGALMGVLEKVEPFGGKVVIVSLAKSVAEVFELLGINDVFPIAETMEEAVAKF